MPLESYCLGAFRNAGLHQEILLPLLPINEIYISGVGNSASNCFNSFDQY